MEQFLTDTPSCQSRVPITNGDRIRAKLQDDKVLAKYTIDSCCDGDTYWCSDKTMFCNYDDALEHEIEWLHQPASFSWPHENGISARGHENIGEVSQ